MKKECCNSVEEHNEFCSWNYYFEKSEELEKRIHTLEKRNERLTKALEEIVQKCEVTGRAYPIARKALEDEWTEDPSPYCSYGHKTKRDCDCGPIADND